MSASGEAHRGNVGRQAVRVGRVRASKGGWVDEAGPREAHTRSKRGPNEALVLFSMTRPLRGVL